MTREQIMKTIGKSETRAYVSPNFFCTEPTTHTIVARGRVGRISKCQSTNKHIYIFISNMEMSKQEIFYSWPSIHNSMSRVVSGFSLFDVNSRNVIWIYEEENLHLHESCFIFYFCGNCRVWCGSDTVEATFEYIKRRSRPRVTYTRYHLGDAKIWNTCAIINTRKVQWWLSARSTADEYK